MAYARNAIGALVLMSLMGMGALTGFGAANAAAQDTATICARNAEAGDVAACERAVEENPGDLDVRRNFARSLIFANDYKAAIRAYREIAAERPDDPQAHYDLASLLGTIRRYKEAVAPIEAVLRLQPDNMEAHQAASVIYAQVGRLRDAVAITKRAAELGDSMSMFEMSLYYEDGIGIEKDPEKAYFWAEQAARRDHVAAMQRMTTIYLEGLFGRAPDEKKATEWAARARRARGAGAVQ